MKPQYDPGGSLSLVKCKKPVGRESLRYAQSGVEDKCEL